MKEEEIEEKKTLKIKQKLNIGRKKENKKIYESIEKKKMDRKKKNKQEEKDKKQRTV